MKKERFLKVVYFCVCISVSLFLFAAHSNSQFFYNPPSYQQSYAPYGPYNPYASNINPYLEDGYSPPPNFSNWNWTDPWTAYDPSGGGAVSVMWAPGYTGSSPYFQQNGYNPWNQPYNYGWNMPNNYGYGTPYGGYSNLGYPYGGYSIYGQSLPDYGSSPFGNYGFNTGYYNYGPGYSYGPPSYNYGWNQPYNYNPYGYYQMPTLANDMFGYGYPSFNNPYGMYGDTRYFQ
jgi:hypothetical protein